MIEILIADDHPALTEGLEVLLNQSDLIFVKGTANNGQELIEKYVELKPDVILVDISMPVLDGLTAFKETILTDRKVNALFYSNCGSKYEIYKMFEAGAKGYISKNRGINEIINAIKTVFEGDLYFDTDFTPKDYSRFHDSISGSDRKIVGKKLSKREMEIIALIAQGLTSQEISKKLHISLKTIEVHRRNMRKKLGLIGSNDLLKFALGNIAKNTG